MTRMPTCLVTLALLSGCGPSSPHDFSKVLPDARLKINLPVTDTSGLRTDVGDTSEYFLFTAQVTTEVNGLIGQVLDTVEAITDFEPTWADESENTAVWGPWEEENVETVLAVRQDALDGSYAWGLDLRNEGEGDGDWVTVFTGQIDPGATEIESAGRLAIDFDALSTFDSESITGVFAVEYDVTDETTSASAAFEGFSEDGGDETDVAYVYDQEHGEGGMMDLAFLQDVTGNEIAEVHIVRSRWHKEGDGRADAYVTEGDFGALVYRATECWKQDHAVTFYEDNADLISRGDEADCTFAESDWNDAPAR
jgi:hypothetical protein